MLTSFPYRLYSRVLVFPRASACVETALSPHVRFASSLNKSLAATSDIKPPKKVIVKSDTTKPASSKKPGQTGPAVTAASNASALSRTNDTKLSVSKTLNHVSLSSKSIPSAVTVSSKRMISSSALGSSSAESLNPVLALYTSSEHLRKYGVTVPNALQQKIQRALKAVTSGSSMSGVKSSIHGEITAIEKELAFLWSESFKRSDQKSEGYLNLYQSLLKISGIGRKTALEVLSRIWYQKLTNFDDLLETYTDLHVRNCLLRNRNKLVSHLTSLQANPSPSPSMSLFFKLHDIHGIGTYTARLLVFENNINSFEQASSFFRCNNQPQMAAKVEAYSLAQDYNTFYNVYSHS